MKESQLQSESAITGPIHAKMPSFQIPPMASEDSAIVRSDELTTEDQELGNSALFCRKIKAVIVLVALQTCLFLTALDSTIVSTCLPRISSDFNEFTLSAWVANSYIICYDSFQPLFSKLNDIFGRKWTLLTGMIILMTGSLLCGVATNIMMLIACRAIAGVGSAAVLSAVSVITFELAPLEKRGNYQGIMNAVWVFAAVVGPLIGGGFTDMLTWRWCFYINLPIGGVLILLLFYYLDLPAPETKLKEKLKHLDYVGTLLTIALTTLFLSSLKLGETYSWNSPMVLVPLILSFVLIGALILVECKFAADPILPPHLLKIRSVLALLSVNWWSGIPYFAAIYYMPLYCQVIHEDSAMMSGIRLIPMQTAICIASTGAGFMVSKMKSYRFFNWLGTSLLTVSIGLISILGVDSPFGIFYGATFLCGFGSGLVFCSTIISLQASVVPQDISVVTGLGDFARLLGASVGIAIAGTTLNSRLSMNLPAVIPLEYVEPITKSSLFLRDGLPKQYLPLALKVYAKSIQVIFYIMAPLAALSFVSSLVVENYDLCKPGEKIGKLSADEGSQEPKGV